METMLNLSESLYHHAQRAAASQGLSLDEFIAGAIQQQLQNKRDVRVKTGKVKLPLVRSQHPGTLHLTADRVAEILEQEEEVSSGH